MDQIFFIVGITQQMIDRYITWNKEKEKKIVINMDEMEMIE